LLLIGVTEYEILPQTSNKTDLAVDVMPAQKISLEKLTTISFFVSMAHNA